MRISLSRKRDCDRDTVDAVLRNIYTEDFMRSQLPPAPPTKAEIATWKSPRDGYSVLLTSRGRDGRMYFSHEPLRLPPSGAPPRAFIAEMDLTLRRALQRHFFLLAHARGGYG